MQSKNWGAFLCDCRSTVNLDQKIIGAPVPLVKVATNPEEEIHTFAKEAEQVVAKWKWAAMPAGILDKPVKTQTRFEFCLEDGSGQCRLEKLASKTGCSGSDIIASVGMRVSRG